MANRRQLVAHNSYLQKETSAMKNSICRSLFSSGYGLVERWIKAAAPCSILNKFRIFLYFVCCKRKKIIRIWC